MGRRTLVTPEIARARIERGDAPELVALEYGCCRRTVMNALSQAGICYRHITRDRAMPEKLRLLDGYKGTVTIYDLAKSSKKSVVTVRAWLRQAMAMRVRRPPKVLWYWKLHVALMDNPNLRRMPKTLGKLIGHPPALIRRYLRWHDEK